MRSLLRLLWRAARASLRHKALLHAAALSYYTLFALGPVLYFALHAAALLVGPEEASAALFTRLPLLLGEDVAEGAAELLGDAAESGPGALGAALGVAFLAFAAWGAFAQLRDSLNDMWGIERREKAAPVEEAKSIARHHSVSLAAALVATLLAGLGLAASGLLGALATAHFAVPLLGAALAFLLLWALFALAYRLLPAAEVAWRDAAVGGLVTSVLFLVAEGAMAVYARIAPSQGLSGIGGAILILLLWTYATALLVLYGAEFTKAWADEKGEGIRPDEHAKPRADRVKESV